MPSGVPAERIGKNEIEFFIRVGIKVTPAVVYGVMNTQVSENVTAKIDIFAQQVINAFHKLHDHNFLDALHALEKTRCDASTHADYQNALRLVGAHAHQRAAFIC